MWDGVSLGIFNSRLEAVCEEMGLVLQRTAFSPNIKDRLDFSCAVFDAAGCICAQAAHIPVHLGSMAYAMFSVIREFSWQPGDVVVLNDPFMGGTHLPDVTLVAPVFVGGALQGFVANRAHHANIGAAAPGSMPLSRSLAEEGLLIPPSLLYRAGVRQEEVWAPLAALEQGAVGAGGDFMAQVSACRVGVSRLEALVVHHGPRLFQDGLRALNDYGARLAWALYDRLPKGQYLYEDVLDDDGAGTSDVRLKVVLTIGTQGIIVDFFGTDEQVPGNVNCPLSVTAAAVYYVFRCLLPANAPACWGVFKPVRVVATPGSVLNAQRPAAVAAGNVETSSRVVDLVLGALAKACPDRVPAASHGSMNNVAMGSNESGWHYYETMGGGAGAGREANGASGIQTHMTNTLNTPIESLERHYPLLVQRYQLREGSGGRGMHRGGDGLRRELKMLAPAQITLLTERRSHRPWGLAGAEPGCAGVNRFNGVEVPGKCTLAAKAGDVLCVESAGGGGWGAVPT